MVESISRGTRRLIKETIQATIDEGKPLNQNELLDAACESLCTKFESPIQLEYQLRRMNIETTMQLLGAIDYYIKNYFKSDFR